MNQRKYSRTSWLTAATRGIRFGPDREAVARELLDHLEDKTADLRRIFPDMAGWEAEELALSRMGDPEEIGMELAKIHRPWLGYLWQASGIILKVLAAVLIFTLFNRLVFHQGLDGLNSWGRDLRESRESKVIAQVLYEDAPRSALDGSVYAEKGVYFWTGTQRLERYPIHSEQRLGEATVTFSDAALWQMEEGTRVLYVRTQIAYDDIRDKSQLFPLYLQAEDDLGNHYGHYIRYNDNGGASMGGFGSFGQEHLWNGYIWNLSLEVPEEAQWVRFTYALRPEADFEFVLELKEGAE